MPMIGESDKNGLGAPPKRVLARKTIGGGVQHIPGLHIAWMEPKQSTAVVRALRSQRRRWFSARFLVALIFRKWGRHRSSENNLRIREPSAKPRMSLWRIPLMAASRTVGHPEGCWSPGLEKGKRWPIRARSSLNSVIRTDDKESS